MSLYDELSAGIVIGSVIVIIVNINNIIIKLSMGSK